MQDFSDLIGTVDAMIVDFGLDAMLVAQVDTGEYDPATATNTVVITEIPIRAILMELTLQSNGQGTRDKTLIMDGDKVLYTRPSGAAIAALMPNGVITVDSTDDRVIAGGVKYKVVTTKVVDPTGSGANPIMFELYLRR
jgi:hypothetical protein